MGCSCSGKSKITEAIAPLSLVDKVKVNAITKKVADNDVNTVDKLCDYFKENTKELNVYEKAWLAFYWMGRKVKYGLDAYKDDDNNGPDSKPKSYSGHSIIYKKLAGSMGLETVKIEGYVKNLEYDPESPFSEPNHMWNAVKIDDSWKLIDSAWSSKDGNSGNNDDFYFCTDPQKFIRSHLPDDPKWQLLSKPVSKAKYDSMLKYDSFFYDCNLLSVEPDESLISLKSIFECSINFQQSSNVFLLGKLSTINDNNPVKIENAIFIQKYVDHFKAQIIVNKKGKYTAEFFAKIGDTKNYKYIFEYKIICDEDAPKEMQFPAVMAGYDATQPILYEPLIGPLKKNTKVNFRVKLNHAFAAAIVVGEKWNHLKKDNDIFEGEATINEDEVGLFYSKLGDKTFNQIFKFPVAACDEEVKA